MTRIAASRSRWLWIAGSVSLLVAMLIYGTFDPSTERFFPKCLFKMATGYDCPGCGSQRAIHSLLHGDIMAAMGYNALFVAAVPFLCLMAWASFSYARSPRLLKALTTQRTCNIILAIIVAWWIGRNIFLPI